MTHPSHRIWRADDPDLPANLRYPVIECGMAVCRICREYEAGLSKSCRQAWLERRRDEIVDDLMLMLPGEPEYIPLKAELVMVNCDLAILKNEETDDGPNNEDPEDFLL